jgi:uncharacterized protein (DUF983 family)
MTQGQAVEDRDLKSALRRGWWQRCPACGEGALFRSFLKVQDACPFCRAELHHHRADDGPAYLTILIVGHLFAPAILFVYFRWQPSPWTMAIGFSISVVVLSLMLLPRIKGAIVGLQWAKRMHGFGRDQEPIGDESGLADV